MTTGRARRGGFAAHTSAEGAGKRRGLLRALLLFLFPLAVRVVVHAELAGDPYYDHLFIDARVYHEIARVLATGAQEMTGPHWQPPLYPGFLSWIYRLSGPDPVAARWVQMVLGALGAVMTFRLAEKLCSKRAAWIAWGAVSLAGPLVFFDLQLLPAALASFLLTSVVLLLSPPGGGPGPEARPEVGVVRAALAGLLAGLGALTVGNLAILGPLVVLTTVVERLAGRRSVPRGSSPHHVPWLSGPATGAFLALWMLPLIVNTADNHRVSGEFIPIAYNGGINFWIGNNPHYDQTVGIRPGRAWRALTAEPMAAGATSYRAQSDYFLHKSLAWMRSEPGAAFTLAARKLQLFLRGDEIPRNQDLYPFRESSLVLAMLLWIHGTAFPTGWILPLGCAGMVLAAFARGEGAPAPASRRFLRRLSIFILLFALSIVAFFVTSRYRAPLLPLLALFAGHAVDRLLAQTRDRWARSGRGRARVRSSGGEAANGTGAGRGLDRGPALAAAATFALVLLLGHIGLPPMRHAHGSDTQYDLGLAYQNAGDLERAGQLYETAIALDPNNAEAHNNLAGLALQRGDAVRAETHLRAVLLRYPDDVSARLNLVRALLARGQAGGAEDVLGELEATMPTDDRVRALRAKIDRTRDRSDDPGGAQRSLGDPRRPESETRP